MRPRKGSRPPFATPSTGRFPHSGPPSTAPCAYGVLRGIPVVFTKRGALAASRVHKLPIATPHDARACRVPSCGLFPVRGPRTTTPTPWGHGVSRGIPAGCVRQASRGRQSAGCRVGLWTPYPASGLPRGYPDPPHFVKGRQPGMTGGQNVKPATRGGPLILYRALGEFGVRGLTK